MGPGGPRGAGAGVRAGPRVWVLSGCSGGGKSTLLRALADKGFAGIAEPGRRLVADPDEPAPWSDPEGFSRRAIDMALADLQGMQALPGPVFLDRGLGDALAAYERATGREHPAAAGLAGRFAAPVFMAPPWPEIYTQDAQRRHGLDAAVAEYEFLSAFYPRHGYRVVLLPRVSVPDRVAFVLARITP
mgnify:FL=1